MTACDVAVIGAGIAGLGAADEVQSRGRTATVFEAASHRSGHTSSVKRDGFVFDEGPHVSFTKNDRVRDVFTSGAGSVHEFAARITNYYQGKWFTHPAQCHLYGADPDLIARCIEDLVESRLHPVERPRNYEEWCIDGLGETFFREFTARYTRKYWTVDASEMTTDWVAERMYPPKIGEVVRGALNNDQTGDFHYLSSFRYPADGGFESFLRDIGVSASVQLDRRLVELDLEARVLKFGDGSEVGYVDLISTMPLPLLIQAISSGQCPQEVRDAAGRLRCTSMLLVDVAVARSDLFSSHWFYVYDEDLLISRGHFPHMLASGNAPSGCGNVQLEVYFGAHKPLPDTPANVASTVVDELVHLGILKNRDEVLWVRDRVVPFANVLFDHDRKPALDIIRPWLATTGIEVAGRYGEWGYLWTDDSLASGWSAAERVCAR
jgi:protoporphyrinogen oxidase